MKSQKETRNIENPALFYTVLLFLIISISFLVMGFLRGDGNSRESLNAENVVEKTEEEESISQYFEETFERTEGEGSKDVFLQGDPFRKVCADASEGSPVISFGTVCLR
jgi:hypothetical protein